MTFKEWYMKSIEAAGEGRDAEMKAHKSSGCFCTWTCNLPLLRRVILIFFKKSHMHFTKLLWRWMGIQLQPWCLSWWQSEASSERLKWNVRGRNYVLGADLSPGMSLPENFFNFYPEPFSGTLAPHFILFTSVIFIALKQKKKSTHMTLL